MKKVKIKITLTVASFGTAGGTGEAILKALEDAGFNVFELRAQYYPFSGSVTVKKEGK